MRGNRCRMDDKRSRIYGRICRIYGNRSRMYRRLCQMDVKRCRIYGKPSRPPNRRAGRSDSLRPESNQGTGKGGKLARNF